MFLLGFLARGGFDSDSNPEAQTTDTAKSLGLESQNTGMEQNRNGEGGRPQAPGDSDLQDNYVTVPYSRDEPLTRLEALEKVRYQVPGYAFAHLVPEVFNRENHISPSMSYIMELSDDEEQSFNKLLDNSVEKIREIESKLVQVEKGKDGMATIVVPSFSDAGNTVRTELLEHIESNLGHERRQIFEMIMINQPAAFGGYGERSLALKNPEFELVNGHRKIITLQVGTIVDAGTDDERFEGIERTFVPEAFEKRYGHLFELESTQ